MINSGKWSKSYCNVPQLAVDYSSKNVLSSSIRVINTYTAYFEDIMANDKPWVC